MNDRSISANTAIAYALWTIGAAFIVLAFFHPAPWSGPGTMFVCAGAVTQVRGYFCKLAVREQEVFQMGRDSVRSIR